MFTNSSFSLFKSPKIVYENPEFSPLQILSKFHSTNKKNLRELEEDSTQRNVNHFDVNKYYEENKNKMTPSFKIPTHNERTFKEIMLKGNIIINQNDEQNCENICEQDHPNFSSSLRRKITENDTDYNTHQISANSNLNFLYPMRQTVTNIIINYQNINNVESKKATQSEIDNDSPIIKTMSFKLNEILINGKKIEHLINLQIDEADSIEIIKPFYENNFYFLNKNIAHLNKGKRISKCFKNLISLVDDAGYINKLVATHRFREVFEMKYNKFSVISIDPLNAYKKCVNEFKKKFNALQNDYLHKVKKKLNNNLLNKLNDSIDNFNNLVDVIFDCVNYIKRGKGVKRKKKKVDYECEICEKVFENAQSKGGHMSKMHPNESLKYKSKILVRDSRVKSREIVLQAKKNLLKKYNFDYDQLMLNMEKHVISEILKLHKSEYNKIKKQLKSEWPSDCDEDTK